MAEGEVAKDTSPHALASNRTRKVRFSEDCLPKDRGAGGRQRRGGGQGRGARSAAAAGTTDMEDGCALGTLAQTVVAVAKPGRVRKPDGPQPDAPPQKSSRLSSLRLPSGEAEGAGRGADVNLSGQKSDREGPPRKRIKRAGVAPCVERAVAEPLRAARSKRKAASVQPSTRGRLVSEARTSPASACSSLMAGSVERGTLRWLQEGGGSKRAL